MQLKDPTVLGHCEHVQLFLKAFLVIRHMQMFHHLFFLDIPKLTVFCHILEGCDLMHFIKGLVHPKMKILSLISQPQIIPNP